jgi:peptidoglycan/xylan/chitin deacetylase (PgdA/CDA1 family)
MHKAIGKCFVTNKSDEVAYWNAVFSTEDPWNYKSEFETRKYKHTLNLLPDCEIGRALELGCAEGVFTEMLTPRVGALLAADISDLALERARKRCGNLRNVRFQQHDISGGVPGENYDLIVCSEILYYLRDLDALNTFAARAAESLAVGGYLLMTHLNMVCDGRSVTGFDSNEIGAKLIGEVFSSLNTFEFLRELRTPLYRVQLFRRRSILNDQQFSTPQFPKEVLEREASFEHPGLKLGGCVITAAEARHCWVTRDLPILMYHRVANDGPEELAPYRVKPAMFERQLAYLQRHGYHSIDLEDFYELWFEKGMRDLPGRAVILTFDDAYDDFYENAWPLLRKYGFGATVFVPTNYVGGVAEWDRGHGDPPKLMKWEQMVELCDNGVEFGSHGCSHKLLTEMSRVDAAQEAVDSKALLEKMLGRRVSAFCYPFSGADTDSQEILAAAGYTHAVCGAREYLPQPDNCFYLPRIEIFGDQNMDDFIAKLPEPELADISQRTKYQQLRDMRDRATYMLR